MKLINTLFLVFFIIFISGCVDSQDVSNNAYCEEISHNLSDKEQCLLNFAIEQQDEFLCDSILSLGDKDYCYLNIALKKQESDVCMNIVETYMEDKCYFELAKIINVSLCNNIKDIEEKEFCFVYIYIELAVEEKDIGYCDKITHINAVDNCFSEMAVVLQDYSLCEKKVSEKNRMYCYSIFAESMNDYILCGNITDIAYKNKCYINIASATKNISLCEYVIFQNDVINTEFCYFLVAVDNLNVDLCDIVEPSQKDYCIYRIATETNNGLLCKDIIDIELQDLCYEEL